MTKHFFSMMLLCAVVVFSSCSKDDDENETIAVTGVSVNKTTLSLVVDATETLVATITPDNATNKNVQWKSSNATIATVSADGIVTAKAAGNATITVTTEDGNKTATCAVTVTNASYAWYKKNKTATSFEISTVAELKGFTNLVNGTDNTNSGENAAVDFAGKTITLKAATTFNLNNKEWIPIGTDNYEFKGTFDGNNNSVSGLKVSSGQYIGLFGYVSGATLKNIKIDGGVVSGGATSRAGGLTGCASNSTIENCSSSATISGLQAGGIVGLAFQSNIKGCYASGNVTAIDSTIEAVIAGGVVGNISISGSVKACYYTTGTVTGGKAPSNNYSCTGGVIGYSDAVVEVRNCYSTGSVVAGTAGGSIHAGGVVGYANFSSSFSNLLYVSGKGATSGVGEKNTDTAEVKAITAADKLAENITWLNTNLPGSIGWSFNADGTLKKAN